MADTGAAALRPVLSWRAKVTPGAPASTPASGLPTAASTARRPSTVATVPLGYADGVPRRYFTAGRYRAHRRPAPPAGRDGHDGPDRGGLRPDETWPWVTTWCSSASRGRVDHGHGLGRGARHHRPRGVLRHRAPRAACGRRRGGSTMSDKRPLDRSRVVRGVAAGDAAPPLAAGWAAQHRARGADQLAARRHRGGGAHRPRRLRRTMSSTPTTAAASTSSSAVRARRWCCCTGSC